MAHPSSGAVEGTESQPFVPWGAIERRTAPAFVLGGGLLVASAVAPPVLAPVTGLAWAAGLVLAGLAVVAVAAGLVGTYPTVSDRSPWLGRTGLLCATVAGGAALALVGMVGAAVVAAVTFGVALPEPKSAFRVVALSMAGGYSLGFVLLGVARLRTDGRSRRSGGLLVAGGAVLAVPLVGELLRTGFGVGPPSWVVFPALGVVAVDTLAVGYRLRTARREADAPDP